jgi:hypothetical protein
MSNNGYAERDRIFSTDDSTRIDVGIDRFINLRPKKDIPYGLYRFVDDWDGYYLFSYIVIVIFIMWFVTKIEITLNTIVGLVVSMFVLNYFNHQSIVERNTAKDIYDIKKEATSPKSNGLPGRTPTMIHERRDATNFLFSIQELRSYNPQTYDEFVEFMDRFFEYRKILDSEPDRCYTYYGLMENAKRDSLNALKSIIHSIPEDRRVRAKLNRAVDVADDIMTKYLDQVSYIIDDHVYHNGYNVNTKIIDYGAKPYNEYDDIFEPYTYESY